MPDAEFIQDIVENILHKLNYTFSIDTKGPIGIDSQVNKLMSLLAIGLDNVLIIGIRGMAGIGIDSQVNKQRKDPAAGYSSPDL